LEPIEVQQVDVVEAHSSSPRPDGVV